MELVLILNGLYSKFTELLKQQLNIEKLEKFFQ